MTTPRIRCKVNDDLAICRCGLCSPLPWFLRWGWWEGEGELRGRHPEDGVLERVDLLWWVAKAIILHVARALVPAQDSRATIAVVLIVVAFLHYEPALAPATVVRCWALDPLIIHSHALLSQPATEQHSCLLRLLRRLILLCSMLPFALLLVARLSR